MYYITAQVEQWSKSVPASPVTKSPGFGQTAGLECAMHVPLGI
jgi:hypothetical protein